MTHTQNGVVEYGYDKATRGTLPLSETWRVTADGVLTSRAVSWTHDSFARVASWTVEGGPSLAVNYDGDGMLASVGALTIERDATAGTEQGTTLTSGGGTVATTQRYSKPTAKYVMATSCPRSHGCVGGSRWQSIHPRPLHASWAAVPAV